MKNLILGLILIFALKTITETKRINNHIDDIICYQHVSYYYCGQKFDTIYEKCRLHLISIKKYNEIKNK